MNSQLIGQRLKQERSRLGFTQPQVGDIAGAVKTTVIDWENGLSSPKTTQLAMLCERGFDPLFVLTGVRAISYPGRSDEDREIAAVVLDLAFALPIDDREIWTMHGQALLNRAIDQGRSVIKRRVAVPPDPPAFLRHPDAAVHEPRRTYKKKEA